MHLVGGRRFWCPCCGSLHGRDRGGGTRICAGVRVWFTVVFWAGARIWMEVSVCFWDRVRVVFVVAFGVAVTDMGCVRSMVVLLSISTCWGCLWDCKKESEGSVPRISST